MRERTTLRAAESKPHTGWYRLWKRHSARAVCTWSPRRLTTPKILESWSTNCEAPHWIARQRGYDQGHFKHVAALNKRTCRSPQCAASWSGTVSSTFLNISGMPLGSRRQYPIGSSFTSRFQIGDRCRHFPLARERSGDGRDHNGGQLHRLYRRTHYLSASLAASIPAWAQVSSWSAVPPLTPIAPICTLSSVMIGNPPANAIMPGTSASPGTMPPLRSLP